MTAGTPYWVVVTTDNAETTTFGAWNLTTTEQITAVPAASNTGSGWGSYMTTLAPAFAVYGK